MPDLPISWTQLGKLGDRLRDATEIDSDDLGLLAAVLGAYDDALELVRSSFAVSAFIRPTA